MFIYRAVFPAISLEAQLETTHLRPQGKPVASKFDPKMVEGFYHQLHTRGVPLTLGQAASLDRIIQKWYINEWAAKPNYPVHRGKAPPPPVPQPVEEEGFARSAR